MFARYSRVSAGTYEDQEKAINDVEKALQAISSETGKNIDIVDRQTGKFRDFTDVISDLNEVWGQLSDPARSLAAGAFAGVRQQEIFFAAMSSADEVTRLYTESLNAAGTAAERYEIYLDSLEAAQNRATASWEAMIAATVDGGLINWFYDAQAGLFDYVTELGGLDALLPSIATGLLTYATGTITATTATVGLTAAVEALFTFLSSNIVAIAATAVFLATNEVVKFNKEVGRLRDDLASNWRASLQDMAKEATSTGEIIKEFSDKMEYLNSLSGAEARRIDKYNLVREGLTEVFNILEETSSGWDEYSEKTREAAEAAGYLVDGNGRLYKNVKYGANIVKEYYEGVDTLTYSQWTAGAAADELAEKIEMVGNASGRAANEVAQVIEAVQSFVYNGLALTKEQFSTISNDLGQTVFDAATYLGVTLQDVNGVVLASGENVGIALANELISFHDISNQLLAGTAMNAQETGNVISQVSSFITDSFSNVLGITPYTPTAPTFKSPSSSGGSGGVSPEKQRIDTETKALENKRDAIKDNINAMKDQIDAQKEALRLQKEESEFLDEIKRKNESLSDIKAEITLLSLDDSEEAKAKRLKLEEEAATLEEEIASDNADRKYELQVEALDAFMDDYEKSMEKQIDALDDQIDKLKEQSSAISSSGGAAASYGDTWQNVGSIQNQVAESIINALHAIGDATEEQKSQLGDYINRLLQAGVSADQVAIKAQNALNMMNGAYSLSDALAKREISWGDYMASGGIRQHHDGGLVESHHDGGFAGGLKSNEVYSKLLKGEYVATESQMDNFLMDTLPSLLAKAPEYTNNVSGGEISIAMPININGNVDDSTLPKIEAATRDVVEQINKALSMRGHLRNSKKFSL